ncbi:hypothetical protein M405DRAFT_841505 [Rhizopogon salebrosus TDB-379]|nr:hypothetical protein M405DRAFT_841505 [Rhizopogon salebrosus TDB-379]
MSLDHMNVTAAASTSDGTSVEKLSVFDMLNILRRRLFIGLEELQRNISVATKTEHGEIDWVVLSPAYHGTLVKTALHLVLNGASAPSLVPLVKRTLFVYILELLQAGKDLSFFTLKKGATAYNSGQQEKKRLARKRSRAAKRERERIEKKGGHVVIALKRGDEHPLTCPDCATPFRSRKQLKKHTCSKKSASKSDVATTDSTVTPAVTVPSPAYVQPPASASPTPLVQTLPEPSSSVPTVADLSEVVLYARWAKSHGVERVCENCPTYASFVVMHGSFETACYLKCEACNRGRGEYLPDCERW